MKRFALNTSPIHATCFAVLTGFHFVVVSLTQSSGQTITLADDGRARFQIVAASDADGIEDYAAQTLAG